MQSASLFVKRFCGSFVIFGGILFTFILALDPYMNIGLVAIEGRAPVSQNQRFAYPAVARDPRFNSAIIGTSTSRLFDPAGINSTEFRFANLSMNSATAYEQEKIFRLFLHHHPKTKAIVFGIDGTWCQTDDDVDKLTFRAFPEWMYDSARWNDFLYMFNDKALENSVRMAQLLAGLRDAKYRIDGYRDFTADFGEWQRQRVMQRLYRGKSSSQTNAAVRPVDTAEISQFPLIRALRVMVQDLSASAQVVMVIPPLHHTFILRKSATMSACKGALLRTFDSDERVQIIDYFYTSKVTLRDENYWDQLHFTREVATTIEQDITDAIRSDSTKQKYRRPDSEHALD